VCSLVIDVACLAVGRSRPEEPEGSFTPAARQEPTDSPRLSADSVEHDFGTVSQKTSLEHFFKLTNTGTAPLKIFSVEESCGCTSTLLSEEVLEPGQSGELKVNFKSGSMVGPFRKKVTVFTNARKTDTQLYIKGSVQPLYTVDPGMLTFGQVRDGEEYRRTVVIQARQAKTPFEVGRVRCLDPQVQIGDVTSSGRKASFEVVFTPAAEGWEQGSISYETGNPEMPRGYLRYSGRRSL
jgi:hypothetical protein